MGLFLRAPENNVTQPSSVADAPLSALSTPATSSNEENRICPRLPASFLRSAIRLSILMAFLSQRCISGR